MSQQRMTCAEATLRSMVDAGADRLFDMPGRGVYPLLNQLPKFPQLAHVTAPHEFPLAAMADGYARIRGQASFLNLYMSTGVLNGSSAIFVAARDRVPLVVTATQAESWAVGADHRAEISDIIAAVRPFTKWAWMPPTPDRVPEALRRAYTIATTPPCGPTFVAIPVDYWDKEIDYTPWTPTVVAQARLDPADERIADIARALEEAEFPLLVVGYEAIMAGVSERLTELASRYSCPIVAEPDPAMLPAPVHFELFGGTLVEAAELVGRADVILHVGVNTYEAVHGRVLHAGRSKRHFWMGSSGQELNKIATAAIAVMGPVGPSVAALAAACQKTEQDRANPRLRRRAQEVREQIAADRQHLVESRRDAWDAQPMSVARICAELRRALPPETVLVEHATTATLLVRENFPLPTSRHYVCASASCQGWGLGAAVGVSFALGTAPVVAIIGDGGFLFGMQAIWTAVQYQRPLLVVILNNGGWSSMRGSVARGAAAVLEAGMDLRFGWDADNAAVCRGLGATAERVTTPAALAAALERHLPLTKGPVVIDVVCRQEPKSSRSPFVGY
jgi:thiamine pyrophosphate-dependent acetolactate synthase large subunit-like protein